MFCYTDVANSGLSSNLAGHPCIGDDELKIPVVMLLIDETNYVLNKYGSGLIQQLTVGRIGDTHIMFSLLCHVMCMCMVCLYDINTISK